MKPTTRHLILLAGLLLAACGRSSTDPAGPDLLKTQREAMDKAKATEQVMQDAAKKQDAQMEQQAK
jgi:hypothetical protein